MKTILINCKLPDYTDVEKMLKSLSGDYEGEFTEIELPTDEEIIEASRWAAFTETPTGNYFDATSGSDYIAGAMWIKSKIMQP